MASVKGAGLMNWIVGDFAAAMARVATPANPLTDADRVPGADDDEVEAGEAVPVRQGDEE